MSRAKIVETAAGLIGGFLVGLVATVVHGGPVDAPIVGLALACAMVTSGAWWAIEMGWVRAWLAGVVGAVAAVIWLLMAPPADDVFVAADRWASNAWLFLAPLCGVLPSLWARRESE